LDERSPNDNWYLLQVQEKFNKEPKV
jgi:hypothetical protein